MDVTLGFAVKILAEEILDVKIVRGIYVQEVES